MTCFHSGTPHLPRSTALARRSPLSAETDIDPTDATDFWTLFGLDGTHAPQPTLNIITNGPDPGFTGDEPEADIDTQWSGAAAPGATIDFVTSAYDGNRTRVSTFRPSTS